jgi:exodeoxyribonuclease-1
MRCKRRAGHLALARLIQEKQPKLFDFALGLHKKDGVLKELGLPATATHARPFLHVSGMIRPSAAASP